MSLLIKGGCSKNTICLKCNHPNGLSYIFLKNSVHFYTFLETDIFFSLLKVITPTFTLRKLTTYNLRLSCYMMTFHTALTDGSCTKGVIIELINFFFLFDQSLLFLLQRTVFIQGLQREHESC